MIYIIYLAFNIINIIILIIIIVFYYKTINYNFFLKWSNNDTIIVFCMDVYQQHWL